MADIISLLSQGSRLDPVGALGRGEQLKSAQTRNRILEMQEQQQIQQAPQRNRLLDLQTQGLEQQIDVRGQQLQSQISTEERKQIESMSKEQREQTRNIIDVNARKAVTAQTPEQLIQLIPEAAEALKTKPFEVFKNELISESDEFGKLFPLTKGKESATTRKKVQSSKLLPGGLVQIVMDDGEIRTVKPKEAEGLMIRQAEERGAELQGLRSGEREEAKNASKQSISSFKELTKVNKNISNLREGIKLLNEGAGTGVIEKRFPSFKAAAIKLDNLQGRLGLDVIGNTTFGALSESELAFALETAIPLGLEKEDLKQWLTNRMSAQEKLSNYLNEAAIFLGTPGNTIADFMQQKKKAQELNPEEQAELEALRGEFGKR